MIPPIRSPAKRKTNAEGERGREGGKWIYKGCGDVRMEKRGKFKGYAGGGVGGKGCMRKGCMRKDICVGRGRGKRGKYMQGKRYRPVCAPDPIQSIICPHPPPLPHLSPTPHPLHPPKKRPCIPIRRRARIRRELDGGVEVEEDLARGQGVLDRGEADIERAGARGGEVFDGVVGEGEECGDGGGVEMGGVADV